MACGLLVFPVLCLQFGMFLMSSKVPELKRTK
jgi:hypothetical protein